MTTDTTPLPRAGHRAIRLDAEGRPWIEAFRCASCTAILAEAGLACRSCGSRGSLEPYRAAQNGKVFSWAVIHRSYPGIPVPFVSAIVDLDDGPTLKGTLREIAPEGVRAGLPVALVFDEAGGACDSSGTPYVGFHFLPAGDEA